MTAVDDTELFIRRHDPDSRRMLVERYRGFAHGLARRFRGRGEDLEDLQQVAAMGLLNAIDRFDPERGVRFTTFAAATIVGELKRHLRDKGWTVRVPRALQELGLDVSRTTEELCQRLGRFPTAAEVAAELGVQLDEVVEAMMAGSAYAPDSLDAPAPGRDQRSRGEEVGALDEAVLMAARWSDAGLAIRDLPERERHILYLRFYEGLTQSEIAEQVGISQMHVSRLLRRALVAARAEIEA